MLISSLNTGTTMETKTPGFEQGSAARRSVMRLKFSRFFRAARFAQASHNVFNVNQVNGLRAKRQPKFCFRNGGNETLPKLVARVVGTEGVVQDERCRTNQNATSVEVQQVLNACFVAAYKVLGAYPASSSNCQYVPVFTKAG